MRVLLSHDPAAGSVHQWWPAASVPSLAKAAVSRRHIGLLGSGSSTSIHSFLGPGRATFYHLRRCPRRRRSPAERQAVEVMFATAACSPIMVKNSTQVKCTQEQERQVPRGQPGPFPVGHHSWQMGGGGAIDVLFMTQRLVPHCPKE